jgi:hypothetical protein
LQRSGTASRAITITNTGDAAAAIDARTASFVLDRRGKPVVVRARRTAAGWLQLQPRRIVLAPHGKAVVAVAAAAPPRAAPGDHSALVLLTTQPARGAGIAIRVRIGVVVFVRVAGRVMHRLELGGVRVHGRVLEAALANRGNVVERMPVRIVLLRGGHVLARLGPAERTLLPHSRANVRFWCPGRISGWVTARVEAGSVPRAFRIRLRKG